MEKLAGIMKILSLYYTHKPGGFCTRLYRLLNALCYQANHELIYLSLDPPPSELLPNIEFERIPFPMRRRSGLIFWTIFSVWTPIYLGLRCRTLRPDRYVVFGAYYSCITALALLLAPAPVVLFLRSLVFKINRVKKLSFLLVVCSDYLDQIGIALATRIVCMTQAMKSELEMFIGRSPSNVVILPNDLPNMRINQSSLADLNLDQAIVAALNSDKLKIVACGVLDQRKNIDLILKALARLGPFNDHLNCFIVGAGPSLKNLKALAATLNLTNVFFSGWCSDPAPIYQKASLVVHPALHEGMPNSIMEALASNVPVLAADIPELRELLVHDELLFSPTEATWLAQALTKIITEPNYLNILKTLSQKRADLFRFDWDEKAIEYCVDL